MFLIGDGVTLASKAFKKKLVATLLCRAAKLPARQDDIHCGNENGVTTEDIKSPPRAVFPISPQSCSPSPLVRANGSIHQQ